MYPNIDSWATNLRKVILSTVQSNGEDEHKQINKHGSPIS